VGLTGRLLWAGLAGMETTAFAALSLAAVWGYSRYGLRGWVAVIFALASQMRPEGHALFALAGMDAVFRDWGLESGDWGGWLSTANLHSLLSRFWRPVALYLLISAPYALFSLAVTGKWLPNTFYAKVGSAHLFSWRTLRETVAYHWQDNPLSLLLLPLGLLPLWRRSRLTVLWTVGLPLLTAVIIDLTWHHGRYTMPLVPFQMVVAAVGAHWLVGRLGIGDWRLKSGGVNRQSLIASLLLLIFMAGSLWQLPHWANMLGSNSREILQIDVALGRWLAENTPPEALIAVDDIGAIAFLSQRRIVDLNGLVSPELWPALQLAEGLPRNQQLTRLLSDIRPDYLAIFPLWRWEIASNPLLVTERHHVRTETHTIIFQQDAYVYRPNWPYLAAVAPQTAVSVHFADGITLLGYDLGVVAAGQPLDVVLYWQAETAVSQSYDLFIHLVDQNGELVAQADGKPLLGLTATNVWRPGDQVRDPRQLLLPATPGDYELRLGLYQRETGVRLALASPTAVDNALPLTTISVPAPAGE
jgi:hypothetical protein